MEYKSKKSLIALIFTLFSIVVFSQELKYEEVVQVDSTVSKKELYNRARSWFADNFKDEGEVMTIQDDSTGEITGNGNFRYNTNKIYMGVWCVTGTIHFKINIYLKDGRYKYVIHNLVHEGSYFDGSRPINYGLLTVNENSPNPSRGGPGKKAWTDIKEKTNDRVQLIISGLKEAMVKKHETSNDW
ncbi:DUF4468 domain-containing protein [Chryseobacterium jejuense]|uniref:DUF4468 domain-containing protein n=1 Tax=Chryseobacterium jejuense TaxID=445960 RepID=A0A2X2VES7_CHRJE|nr:DUF4468 domain-containing protein [Chryseobacterium jejuense]SDI97974.1 protein of unknown function [Chryseobacterium jejuense]SQB27078.1 Uncharacterised protein [Chryseobacterium jejuense]